MQGIMLQGSCNNITLKNIWYYLHKNLPKVYYEDSIPYFYNIHMGANFNVHWRT